MVVANIGKTPLRLIASDKRCCGGPFSQRHRLCVSFSATVYTFLNFLLETLLYIFKHVMTVKRTIAHSHGPFFDITCLTTKILC